MIRDHSLKALLLLGFFVQPAFSSRTPKQADVERATIKGKVFRSDSGKLISNSYVLLARETDPASEHFDTRTNDDGEYVLKNIPPGTYTISIYAWFRNKRDVPCQNPGEERTPDGGDVAVQWQRKSGAFMEIVTIKGLSTRAGKREIKSFDLTCK
jgi:Carboxypeptidase regulatory-like domain